MDPIIFSVARPSSRDLCACAYLTRVHVRHVVLSHSHESYVPYHAIKMAGSSRLVVTGACALLQEARTAPRDASAPSLRRRSDAVAIYQMPTQKIGFTVEISCQERPFSLSILFKRRPYIYYQPHLSSVGLLHSHTISASCKCDSKHSEDEPEHFRNRRIAHCRLYGERNA